MENVLDIGLATYELLGTVYEDTSKAGNILARGRVATGEIGR